MQEVKYVITEEVAANPRVLKAVEDAIHQWNCASLLNLKLSTNTDGSYETIAQNPSNSYRQNVFAIGSFGNALARTSKRFTQCTSPNGQGGINIQHIQLSNAIVFSDSQIDDWLEEDDNNPDLVVPDGELDGRAIALHEIGHAFGLNHVNDISVNNNITDQLMFYQRQADGGTRREIEPPSGIANNIEGIEDMLTRSRQSGILLGCTMSFFDLERSQPCLNGLDEELSSSLLNFFPNPTRDVLRILNGYNLDIISVKMTDQLGRNIGAVELNSGLEMDVSDLRPGIYYLTVFTTDGVLQSSFIKE